jgi:hypothetical protein
MGKKAREIENRILSELPPNKRLFKINAGMGWAAAANKTLHVQKPMTVKVFPGDKVLRQARPLHAAPAGWPDLCGWETIEITADMVGQKIPVFCMEEVKAGNDTLKPAQKKMKKLFEKMGGVFRVVKS